jgi:hypothetical protein
LENFVLGAGLSRGFSDDAEAFTARFEKRVDDGEPANGQRSFALVGFG